MAIGIEIHPLSQAQDLYARVAKPGFQPEIVADIPLLSCISSRVPKGYYRLGMIHVPLVGLQPLPRGMVFVNMRELPAQGAYYITAIDEDLQRYWVLANVLPQSGEPIQTIKPRDLTELVKRMI